MINYSTRVVEIGNRTRRSIGQPPATAAITTRRLRLFGHIARADPSQGHSLVQLSYEQPSTVSQQTGAAAETHLDGSGFAPSTSTCNRSTKNKITRMGFFMDSPLNSRPCHVGWPQDKVAQGKHVGFTSPWFHTEERSKASRGDGHVHGSTCHHMTMMMMMMMMMFCADHWANIIAADAETVIVTRSQERSGCNSCCVCIL